MKLTDTIKNIYQSATDLAKTAGEKTNENLELQKLAFKSNSLRHDIKEEYKKIGEYYYNKFADAPETEDETLISTFERIAGLKADLAEKLARIEDIKTTRKEEKAAKKQVEAEECCCCCDECAVCDEVEEIVECEECKEAEKCEECE